MEAFCRFDETRDYGTDNAEDDAEDDVEDDDVEMAVEVLLAAVEGPEPLVYVAPAINQTASTALSNPQGTVAQSITDAAAEVEAKTERLTVDDGTDVVNSDSTSAAPGVAALRQRLRALEVNGLFAADEVHVMDGEIMKLSVRHSVEEIVEMLNTGTGPTSEYGTQVVQEVVDAAVVGVAAQKGQDLEVFRAELEEMRVANGVVTR
ncbi:hypothetical protein LTR54_012384 [Friedmanniomyces endolithicus]|nr:hypothetical protein LTR54_012384 [Friedmanniomyces endolithicus]